MKQLIIAIVSMATVVVAASAEPSINVTLSAEELTVGDRLEVIVTVRPQPSTEPSEVRFQPWGETLGPAEILEVGPVEQIELADDSLAFQQRLVLTLFQVGEVRLPPIEAVLVEAARETPLTSASTRVVVQSVLPAEGEEPEAKPPVPPRRLRLGNRFWWATAALLATCLVALAALWRQAGGLEADEEGRPRLAPMEELRRSLAALRQQPDVAPLHAELSLALRRFFGRILEFPAPESTTTEVRRALRRNRLAPELVRRTADLLVSCDMVMFARRETDLDKAHACIGEAETIAGGLLEALAPENADVTEEAP